MAIYRPKVSAISVIVLLALIGTSTHSDAQNIVKMLIPDEVIVQHAGSIGYGSLGAGYELWKGKGSIDVLYGVVPGSKGGPAHIASAKFHYKPLSFQIKKFATLYPLNPGAFFSWHFGKEYNFRWEEDQYPDGYYWWSPALRSHLSLSNEIMFYSERSRPSHKIKHVSIYNEFNTNDLYAVSWFQNQDSMSFFDIIRIGFGIRVGF